MRQVVTVVLVARNGEDYLERTVAALAAQTRTPDAVIAVDVASGDRSTQLLGKANPAQLVGAGDKSSFGDAIAIGLRGAQPGDAESDNEWLWLLAHDSAPRSEERRVGKECRSRWSTYH